MGLRIEKIPGKDRLPLPAPVGGEAEGRGGPCLSAGKCDLRPILSLHSSLLLFSLQNRRETEAQIWNVTYSHFAGIPGLQTLGKSLPLPGPPFTPKAEREGDGGQLAQGQLSLKF